jgi:uncharacterized protein (DUF488 family)
MFYRRKIILALLQLFDGQLDKLRLQKLLFLFTNRQAKAGYDFIPYKYGCFSYSAYADLTVMVKKDMLAETETFFEKTDPIGYLEQLKPDDRKLMMEVKALYSNMSTTALIKHTYINFPFYAIKSEVAEKILNKEELEKVNEARPKEEKTVLFTIGYEGISLEEYLVRLLKHDVKVLVDVRNNPLSMKYGFSKSQLKKYCAGIGIDYVHIPEVGIQTEQRQQLNTQSDYDSLFDMYRNNILTGTIEYQEKILQLLKQYKRIALTCFEANINQCHRKHLAEAVSKLAMNTYDIKHI